MDRTPVGRRVEKRRQTFRRVVKAAAELFSAQGYDVTTIEEIAAGAGVSPGTVYNYFGTKSAIVVAVVAERSSGDADAAVAVLDVGQLGPTDAAMAVVMPHIEPMLDLDRALIAEVLAASFRPSHSTLTTEFVAMDQRAIDHLVTVFAALKEAGGIGGHVDPRQAANIVFSVLLMATIAYLTDQTMARTDVGSFIRSHVELAFRGIGV